MKIDPVDSEIIGLQESLKRKEIIIASKTYSPQGRHDAVQVTVVVLVVVVVVNSGRRILTKTRILAKYVHIAHCT